MAGQTVWAYLEKGKGTPLPVHLRSVGELSCRVVGSLAAPRRSPYSVLGERVGAGALRALQAAAGLAGLLHDLGKASHYYQRDKKAKSFRGHELLSAAVAYGVYIEYAVSDNSSLEALLALAAWSVARHHSAMEGRHPRDAGKHANKGKLAYHPAYREAVKAAAKLEPKLAASILVEAYQPLAAIKEPLLEAAEIVASDPQGMLGEAARWLAGTEQASNILEVEAAEWLVLVETVTGALIIGDVLVAGQERRSEDEKESGWKAYAAAWLRELGLHDSLQEAVAGSTRCLDESLAPILAKS